MKKNKWMRLASVLLVLCLITTCTVSGTYAKYVSADSAIDTARVAKWGVNVVAGGTLFSDAYFEGYAGGTNEAAKWDSASLDINDSGYKLTVMTATHSDPPNQDNLVAPGTKSAGDGMIVGLGGKPEVATNVKIKIAAKDVYLEKGTYAYLTPIELSMGTYASTMYEIANSTTASGIAHKLYKASGTTYVEVADTESFSASADYYLASVYTASANYYPVVYSCNTTYSTSSSDEMIYLIFKDLGEYWKNQVGITPTVTANGETDIELEIDADLPANFDMTKFQLCSDATGAPMSITWEWEFSASDEADQCDTVLGDLMRQFKDGLPTGDLIVCDGYEVTIDSNGRATANSTECAFLFTGVEFEITVTQLD